jgi:hypothetical protein
MPSINVSDDFKKLVDAVQEKRGLPSAAEAADAIGHTYAGRMNAIKKYAQAHAAPKAKKAPKAKAKKKAAKKATKAEA